MYEALFTPNKIGTMTIKNRLIVSAAVTRLCNPDNSITEAFIRYQEDKAKGGWGMIITEDQPVVKGAYTFPNIPGIYDDRFADGQKELTARVHAAGAKLCAQIYHPGAAAKMWIEGSTQAKGPSAVECRGYPQACEELSLDEIHEIIKAFGQAARRAKEWGYDAIEVHAAHGYLIGQFLSANTNKRTDEYGGSLINRNRILTDILTEIRSVIGDEFPIQVRISADEYDDYGITLEESMITARLAEQYGANSIHCSTGTLHTGYTIMPTAAADRALYVKNAEQIKKIVNIPVVTVGRINEPILAENAILTGRADFVTMFRASLADPELPNKLREGRFEEINYCIGCMQGCSGSNRRFDNFTCLVRPMTGYAHELEVVPAAQPKKLAVIGGGISGCEAAIYAAQRGHKVTVFEKSDRLGGRWIAASTPPGKSGYTTFINWQKAMLAKYNVEVKLNTEVTVDMMKEFAPDQILLANGAADFIPPIPGVKQEHVVLAQDVLRHRAEVGTNVVVIGGGLVGAETAEYLAMYAPKKVSVVEMAPAICVDGEPVPTKHILDQFKKHDVDVYTSATVKEISDSAVVFEHEGEYKKVKADTVVMATGLRPNNDFYDALIEAGFAVRLVGDASSGKDGFKNIREGFMAGLEV